MIERKTDNNGDRLQFLIQYTKGQAQKLVKSCEYMAPDRGYQKAKELLKENFGNEYKISCGYLDKALSWPQIKSEDSKMLQDYAMFLWSCCNAMEDMKYMEELDTVSNMRSIALKLPYKLREKWRARAYELQEYRNRRVGIVDLVSFIEKQACISADPVFGDLQDQTAIRGKPKSTVKSHPSKATISSYVIGVALPSKELKLQPSCTFCSSKHTLDKCKEFAKKAHKDKLSLLKANGICFGCLQATSHISKDCKQRLTCSICKQAHQSTLHIERKAAQEAEKPFDVIGNTSTELCGHIGAGDQESVLPIVPVNVKAAKGSHVLQVYALLDPGSSATFCSEELMSRLHMKVLLQGPDLTNSLIGVILRFRKEPIGIMADVKSMFHQVRVSKSDVNYLRFLWWPQRDTSQTPREHRMLVHIFGAVSPPSGASFALQKNAADNEISFPPQVAETIRHNFYVDDCAKSVTKESDAIQLVKDLTSLCRKVKQLQQELCHRGFGWDEPLPQSVSDWWMEWTSSLEKIKSFSVPRCLKPHGYGVTRCAELHHFPDASESSYGSVKTARFKTYVANRVLLIRDNTHLSQWRHVSSKHNPADDSSRGLSGRKLIAQKRWIHAPDFLWKSEESWPATEALGSVFQDDPEVRKNPAVFATVVETETPTDQLILYFSDWVRLLKAVAWHLKLKSALMLKMKGGKELLLHKNTCSSRKKMSTKSEDFRTAIGEYLTIKDIAEAERVIIAYVQRQAFSAEIASLELIPPRLHRSSNLCRLDPVLDKGIMRVGGRLHKSAMPVEVKHR
ncbi:hypothetical protein SRHO_G00048550 [Serrasalmus rhombeus]